MIIVITIIVVVVKRKKKEKKNQINDIYDKTLLDEKQNSNQIYHDPTPNTPYYHQQQPENQVYYPTPPFPPPANYSY